MSRPGTAYGCNSIPVDDPELHARFWKFVEADRHTGCWKWTGNVRPGKIPYGRLRSKNKRWSFFAHRVSWAIHYGEIPDGFEVQHRCPNHDLTCVNPDHLCLGKPLDRVLYIVSEGRHWGQTVKHCPHGHEYDESNTLISVNGGRFCRTCANEYSRRKSAAIRLIDPDRLREYVRKYRQRNPDRARTLAQESWRRKRERDVHNVGVDALRARARASYRVLEQEYRKRAPELVHVLLGALSAGPMTWDDAQESLPPGRRQRYHVKRYAIESGMIRENRERTESGWVLWIRLLQSEAQSEPHPAG